jgi:hypothetical protein
VPGRLVGGFVVDQGAFMARSDSPTDHLPLWLRFRVRWFPWNLDECLSRGVDPKLEPALEARSAQLASTRHRRRLAAAIERIVAEADAKPHPRFSVVLGTARDQVLEARAPLLFLAYVLRDADPVGPRGVAIVERLLTDGASPLYVGGIGGAVALRVQTALDCLVGLHNSTPEAWFAVADSERGELVGHS